MPGNSCVISICELCSFETKDGLSNIKRKKKKGTIWISPIIFVDSRIKTISSRAAQEGSPGHTFTPPWQSTNRPNNENQAQAVQPAHKTNLQTLNRDFVLAAG